MLESPKLGEKNNLFRTSLPKWVRVDENEYELTKMSTSWLGAKSKTDFKEF